MAGRGRPKAPTYGLFVANRLNLTDFAVTMSDTVQVQVATPYLMLRTDTGARRVLQLPMT
jgi:hypothetical protein